MAIAVAVDQSIIPDPIDKTLKQACVHLVLTLTSTYPTNGDTLSFLGVPGIPGNLPPNRVEIYEATPAAGPASGYSFVFLPGSNLGNGLMEIFNGTTQFTTQAYGTPPFAITGFALKARAWFPANI